MAPTMAGVAGLNRVAIDLGLPILDHVTRQIVAAPYVAEAERS